VLDTKGRLIAFGTIVVLCVGLAGLYAVYAARRASTETAPAGIRVIEVADGKGVAAADRVLFRSTALNQGYGHVSLVPLSDVAGPRYSTRLVCDRVDFAGNIGSCLTADRGVFTRYRAVIFDERFNPRHTIGLGGIPSRTRVAPNGRLAAITVFVSGHSYAAGAFSTQTTLIDTTTGAVVADVENFAVTRNGRPFKAVDFNFWGVTFAADSNTFYVTLGTGGEQLLIRGDASARTAVVLRAGVECPSISPDGTRLAFKRRGTEGGIFAWRLATLDLQTLTDRLVMGETRSVDDQVEWVDSDHLAYSIEDRESGLGGTSVWTVAVDGGAPSTPWIRGAYSPSVLRSRP
jgi:hypothetical protein